MNLILVHEPTSGSAKSVQIKLFRFMKYINNICEMHHNKTELSSLKTPHPYANTTTTHSVFNKKTPEVCHHCCY